MSVHKDRLIGQVLGQYEIESRIGEGGMATVYLAHQKSIGRQVAIKLLPPHFMHDPSFTKRFQREVQIIARLQHARILPVYDYGEYEGQPYIVMAYMSGGTLAESIQAGPMAMPEVITLVEQIAEGLDHAHREGVVHRDFKPSNVLLDRAGNTYLADFGIAKLSEGTVSATATGVVGTPAYIAPEMASDGTAGPAADIYALGVSIYQMLSGRLPFEGDTPMRQMMAHISEQPPDIRAVRADLTSGVSRVLIKAMAKDPNDRYQTARALASGLRSAGGLTTDTSSEEMFSTMPVMAPADPDATTAEVVAAQRTVQPPRMTAEKTVIDSSVQGYPVAAEAPRHRSALPIVGGLIGLLLLGALAAGGFFIFQQMQAQSGEQGDQATTVAGAGNPDATNTAQAIVALTADSLTAIAAATDVARVGSENVTATHIVQQQTQTVLDAQATSTADAQAAIDATNAALNATATAEAEAAQAGDVAATSTAQAAIYEEKLTSVLLGAYQQNIMELIAVIEPMTPDYGPEVTNIEHQVNVQPNIVMAPATDYENFMLKAAFTNPYTTHIGLWDFGIVFRSTDRSNEYRVRFDAAGSWGVEGRKLGGVTGLFSGTTPWFREEENAVNTLIVIAVGERAYVVLNDQFHEPKVNIFNLNKIGGIGVGIGFVPQKQQPTEFTPVELTIWRLP